ncbi:unnamed protein product, partial [Ectocarpus sp. 12 AP-2014]
MAEWAHAMRRRYCLWTVRVPRLWRSGRTSCLSAGGVYAQGRYQGVGQVGCEPRQPARLQ